jgi:hypothetical protein
VASKTVVEWVDDIDGEPAAETVTFALDGVEYEIDLSTEHATQLRTALTEFIRKARPETTAPRRASATVEEVDEQPVLMPAPATSAEAARHLPAPRSAIKSRISPAQLTMDVEGFDEPAKAPRATRKAAAEKTKEPMEPAKKPAAKTVAAKSASPKSTAKTPPAKQQAPQPKTAQAKTPEPKKPAQPKEAQLKPAAQPPAPEPKSAAQPPAPAPTPAPAVAQEPKRPLAPSLFSQPTEDGAPAPSTKQDGAPRPPMITFSSAKP